jgi:o-succinylbenzoate synthase
VDGAEHDGPSQRADRSETPRRGWAGIGERTRLALQAIELWLIELRFRRPVATSVVTHRHRPLVLVRVVAERRNEQVHGWGECAALADTTYDPENTGRAFAALSGVLVPALVDAAEERDGRLPLPSRLDSVRATSPSTPMAFAALEMAVADAHLRAEGRSLAAVLGVDGAQVPIGVVVGRSASTTNLVSEVRDLARRGYSRIKLKIAPGSDIEPVAAVRGALPDIALQVDANGAYSEAEAGRLAELDRFGLLCIEQPLARDDLEGHVRLASRLPIPIGLDEGVHSPESVRAALAMGACSVVEIKPARLGGVGAALELVDFLHLSGIPMWMGGMFESGYARGVNTTLAALPGFSWPGDTSPAAGYLDDDIVPASLPARLDGHGPLAVGVSRSAGMGPIPGLDRIRTRAVRHQLIEVRPP